MRALVAQLPNLRQQLQQGFYKVRIGKHYLNPEALEQGLFYRLKKGMSLHFTPVIKGAKKAGLGMFVLGVALIGASFFVPAAGLFGGLITKGGLFMFGASMALSGVAQMLTKTPSMGGVGDSREKKSSTAFGNLQNMAAQGRPIPLAYGQIRCGSMIISQGVETVDEVDGNSRHGDNQTGGSASTGKPSVWGVGNARGNTPTDSTASASHHDHSSDEDRHRSTEREEKDRAEQDKRERERNSRMARDIF